MTFSDSLVNWMLHERVNISRATLYLQIKRSDLVRWITGDSEPSEGEKKRVLERISKP